jgi:hypothetical protein
MRKKLTETLSLDFFKRQGKIGGLKGGALSWAGLTPEERSKRAKQAASTRKKKAPAKKTKKV